MYALHLRRRAGRSPIWFCATETPIETPTPTLPPPPIAAENAATVAVIAELLVAVDRDGAEAGDRAGR